jgi:maleate isomerase
MYGRRGRIGLILPSSNTVIEAEFWKMLPEGVSVHASRMKLDRVTVESLIQMEKEIDFAVDRVMDTDPDIVVFGCTTGSLIKGVGYDLDVADRIQSHSKKPAVTTSTAVLEALRALQIRRLSVATPYIEELNQKEMDFLEGNGFRIVSLKGLDASEIAGGRIGRHQPRVAFELGKQAFRKDSDGLFISCTGFRTIEVISLLEKDLGKPVITSNQATLASALKRLKVTDRIKGYGFLLEKGAED